MLETIAFAHNTCRDRVSRENSTGRLASLPNCVSNSNTNSSTVTQCCTLLRIVDISANLYRLYKIFTILWKICERCRILFLDHFSELSQINLDKRRIITAGRAACPFEEIYLHSNRKNICFTSYYYFVILSNP